jgi:hypothetical protein
MRVVAVVNAVTAFAIGGLEAALEVRVLDRCGDRWAGSSLAGPAWQSDDWKRH